MSTSIYHVDAFTSQPFGGNPAAVCLLHGPADEAWMQKVAAEMNLSETAFIHPMAEGYGLRWFTPSTEVDLCGHATLATAHVLWETGIQQKGEAAVFHTKSGDLTAVQNGEWIEMDLPASTDEEVPPPPGLSAALGTDVGYVGRCPWIMIVEVDSEETLRAMCPDFGLLQRIPVDGFSVTARSSSDEYDFVSRFFAPRLGINEDPVTGAAHCCLGPFWQKRLGKDTFTAYQASPRGGTMKVRLSGDRACLSGQAVTISTGVIL